MEIKYPLILDGGLSNELEKAGHNLNHKLWTAKLLDIDPEAIIQVHQEYLNAGAQCITTSSYQASIPGFMDLGYDRNAAEALILKSVQLAEIAIERYVESAENNTKPFIAASIGPYGAYLADGSEYRGNYGVSDKDLSAFHQDRIKILDHSKADFLACETIPSFQEVKVLSEILKDTQTPSWVSFSCKDENHLNDGTPVEKCIDLFVNHPKVFAIGVNCTKPQYVSKLIKTLKLRSGIKKIIAYPNSGEIYNAQSKTWQNASDPDLFVTLAKEWVSLGADMIGGCCRIGPEHIRLISNLS